MRSYKTTTQRTRIYIILVSHRTTIQYVKPATSGPAALSTATSSYPANNRRRSPATRHDAPAAASPAKATDPSRSRQGWPDIRPIHQQAQTASFRKPPTSAANGAAASSESSYTSTRATPDAGAAGATGSYHTGSTRSEGSGAGEMAERAGFKTEDLYIEWTEERDVQRYLLPISSSSVALQEFAEFSNSQACPPSPRLPRLHKSPQQKPSPPGNHRRDSKSRNL